MPKFCFHCDTCDKQVVRIIDASKVPGITCRDCGNPLRRTPQAPSSTVTERLDNGFMTKAVERPADAERLYRERARIDPLKD